MVYKSILFKKNNIAFIGERQNKDAGEIKHFKPVSFVSTKELDSNKFYIVMINDDEVNYEIYSLEEIQLYDTDNNTVMTENIDDASIIYSANASLKKYIEKTVYH